MAASDTTITTGQKITPFLWFDTQAEEAMDFYTSVFKNSTKGKIMRYGDAGPGPKGSVMACSFTLDGVEFTALNGGPMYQFNPAISLYVHCRAQDEVDYFWDKFSAEGTPVQCGWITDKFGVSWQIVPDGLLEALSNPKAMKAMLQMVKLDINVLREAAK